MDADATGAHPYGYILDAGSSLELGAEGQADDVCPAPFRVVHDAVAASLDEAESLEHADEAPEPTLQFHEEDPEADPHAEEVIGIQLDEPRATITTAPPAPPVHEKQTPLRHVLADRLRPPAPSSPKRTVAPQPASPLVVKTKRKVVARKRTPSSSSPTLSTPPRPSRTPVTKRDTRSRTPPPPKPKAAVTVSTARMPPPAPAPVRVPARVPVQQAPPPQPPKSPVKPKPKGFQPPSPLASDVDISTIAKQHRIENHMEFYKISNADRTRDHKTALRRQEATISGDKSGGLRQEEEEDEQQDAVPDPFGRIARENKQRFPMKHEDSRTFPVSQSALEEPAASYADDGDDDGEREEEEEEQENESREDEVEVEEEEEGREAEEEEEEEEEEPVRSIRKTKDATLRTAGGAYGPGLGDHLQKVRDQQEESAEEVHEEEQEVEAVEEEEEGAAEEEEEEEQTSADTGVLPNIIAGATGVATAGFTSGYNNSKQAADGSHEHRVNALVRIKMLERMGHRFERKFDLSSDPSDMNAYADSVEKVSNASRGLDTSRKMLIGLVGFMEYVNSLSPIKGDLDGWSSEVMANIGDFDAVLLKIWERLAASKGEQNPYIELVVMLGLSGGAYHVTRKMVKDRSRRIAERKKKQQKTIVKDSDDDDDSDAESSSSDSSSSSSSSDSDFDSDGSRKNRRKRTSRIVAAPIVAPHAGYNPGIYMAQPAQTWSYPWPPLLSMLTCPLHRARTET
jgi:hypothetical protein